MNRHKNPDKVTFVLDDIPLETWLGMEVQRFRLRSWVTGGHSAVSLLRRAYGPNPPRFTKKVDIKMVVYFAGKMFDCGNLVKMYEDGLRPFIIKDDDLQHVRQVTTEISQDKERPRIELTISLCQSLLHHPTNSFIIKMPGFRSPSWNKFRRRKKHVLKEVTKTVNAHLLTALNGRDHKMFNGRVDVSVIAGFRRKPIDSSNIPAKLYIDGLEGVLIQNNTPEYVRRVSTMSVTSQTRPSVTVVISPVKGKES